MLSRYNPIYLWWNDLHKPTVYSIFCLVSIGLIAVFSASYNIGGTLHVADLYFFQKQIAFIVLSCLIAIFFSFQSTEGIIKLSQLGLVCSLFAMIAVFAMSGKSVKGATRWLDLYIITIQPSEILKPFFIVISAYIYFLFEKTYNFMWPIFHGCLLLIIVIMLFLQPDFGMILTYGFLTGVLILISSIRLRVVLYLVIPVLIILISAIFLLPHVKSRVITFFSGKTSYQVQIAHKAIQNGGLLGRGLGVGEISKKLPDSHNDFIFAKIGEEFGAIFLIVILCLFTVLLISNLMYITNEQEILKNLEFNKSAYAEKCYMSFIVNHYIIILTVALIFFEVTVNVSVNLSLIPPKGMALPFISYGGSSMIAHGCLIGCLCVANRRKYNFLPIGREYML